MSSLDALIADANKIAQTDLYPALCRMIISSLLAEIALMRQPIKEYMVNIRGGQIVGTDSPEVPDGTYIWGDDLPSKGGLLFRAEKTEARAMLAASDDTTKTNKPTVTQGT